ncbi:hypothetical protein QAD02_020929 [Eretmocerus hayati]|uniref:Uncharacterized protein n=1 Tax=Eretmocerus hayati TaxID=131215 RepID=A0ACC2PQP8_9HYME|nr:hypothetical protein QAD02_020929 [Eretmocerus hayati]
MYPVAIRTEYAECLMFGKMFMSYINSNSSAHFLTSSALQGTSVSTFLQPADDLQGPKDWADIMICVSHLVMGRETDVRSTKRMTEILSVSMIEISNPSLSRLNESHTIGNVL